MTKLILLFDWMITLSSRMVVFISSKIIICPHQNVFYLILTENMCWILQYCKLARTSISIYVDVYGVGPLEDIENNRRKDAQTVQRCCTRAQKNAQNHNYVCTKRIQPRKLPLNVIIKFILGCSKKNQVADLSL